MPAFSEPVDFIYGQDVDPADLNYVNQMIDELQDWSLPSAWTYLPPATNYLTATVTPTVRREGLRVYGAGRISGSMGGTNTVAVVPPTFRPVAGAAPPGFDYWGFDIPCGAGRARCRIYADGQVVIDNSTVTGTQIVDLSSINWPVE